MLIFLVSGLISDCISGREGGTGAQRSLHVRIPLNPTIPAVVSACQSDHTSQSYAKLSRIRFKQPLHRWEGRRHRSTTFLTRTVSPRSPDFSGDIFLSIGPHVAELCYCLQDEAKSATALGERRRHQSTMCFTPTDFPKSHNFSGAICLSIGPCITELCLSFQDKAKSATASAGGTEAPEHSVPYMYRFPLITRF